MALKIGSDTARTGMVATLLAAFAVNADAPVPEQKEGAAPVKVLSPRAAVREFLELIRVGKDTDAAKYLVRGTPEQARKLGAVFEGQPRFDLEQVSAEPEGVEDDGLPAGDEAVATVEFGNHVPEHIVMVRMEGEPRWRFNVPTLNRLDVWYERTPNAWAAKTCPTWLTRRGPVGMQFWQWAALLLVAVLSWGVGTLVGRLLSKAVKKMMERTKKHRWSHLIFNKLQGPLTMFSSLMIVAVTVPFMGLPETAGSLILKIVKGGFLAVFFWLLVRAVDVIREVIIARMAADQPSSRSLVSLGSRFTKAVLFTILVIATLSLLGLPVGSLLAGLGIGGLAVALAGQKTLENLIGTFAIGFDAPFREGDFVKVRDFTGTVETIGLRSTRIRTLDRTIITVPNGKLADEHIETFAVRDRMRLALTFPIRYGADTTAIEAAITRAEEVLKQDPEVDASTAMVRLVTAGEWGMGIEVIAMLNTPDGVKFGLTRQRVLLGIMKVVNAAGVTLDPSGVFQKNGTAATAQVVQQKPQPSRS
ncbi:MAG: mechanosensitive ion channel family protein [Archangium sp.]